MEIYMEHEEYMAVAIEEARAAYELEEVPIGAVIVHEGQIIGRGHNLRNTNKNPLAHAEIIAIHQAAGLIGDWRLEECTLYVTVEPCPMCAGAIVQARIPTVVFGTRNKKAGAGGSIFNILQEPRLNHQVELIQGVMGDECAEVMSSFFRELRRRSSESD